MKILGYSERGIINSLIFSIGEAATTNGEDLTLMNDFIGLINIPELQKFGEPIDYEILLEHSFSDFGAADLVIIIEYDNPIHKRALFIEGKVKTLQQKSWSLEKQFSEYLKEENSSNLFFQLYQKSHLMKNKDEINANKGGLISSKIRDRKIGENEIVWNAFKKVAECEQAYYVGLIPTSEDDIQKFNGEVDYDISFLSWETVHNFCKKNEEKLKKVIEIFQYNEGQIY